MCQGPGKENRRWILAQAFYCPKTSSCHRREAQRPGRPDVPGTTGLARASTYFAGSGQFMRAPGWVCGRPARYSTLNLTAARAPNPAANSSRTPISVMTAVGGAANKSSLEKAVLAHACGVTRARDCIHGGMT